MALKVQGACRVRLVPLGNGEAEVPEVQQVHQGQLESQEFRVFEVFLVLMGLLVQKVKWVTEGRVGPQGLRERQGTLEDQDQQGLKVSEVHLEELASRE